MRIGTRIKRAVCSVLAAAVLITCFSGTTAFAADVTLTLPQAISLTLKNSDKLRKVKLSKVKKQIELKQAYSAIADTRKNESTIRFSLLFNIKFPESHAMPKEIELLTKVPDIQNEIRILNAEYENAKLSETAACEQQYYTVVYCSYEIDYYTNLLNEAKAAQKKVALEFAKGNALESDAEYMDKQVSDAQAALTKAKSAYERAKEKLSSIVGIDVSKGYKFSCTFPETEITYSMLPEIKSYALKYDYTYYKALQNKNNAESSTETVKSVYSGRYGSDAGAVMNYLNTCKRTGEKVDYEYFIIAYNNFLTKIDSPWYGTYNINLLFFTIKIPKEWFKRTYSGSRYLEDERYALFVSLAELDEAEQDRVSAYNTLVNGLTDGYYALHESKAAYESAQSFLSKTEKDYADALKDNRQGLLSFTDLYDKKTALLEQQKSIYEMRTDYAKSLSAYNLQSAGYISDMLSGSSAGAIKNYENGVTTGLKASSDVPTWQVNITADYKASFSVSIPEKYDVTHYELYTCEGKKIGKRTEVSKSMTNISTVYSDTSLLTLNFYKDDELKYCAVFDGMQYSGTLDMQSPKKGTADYVAGSWTVTKKGMKSTFSVSSDKFKFDSFELYSGFTLLGKGTNTTGFTHLSSTFGSTEGFTVKLMQEGEAVATLNVTKTEDGQQLLTYN